MLPYDLAILFLDVYPTEKNCDHLEPGVFIGVLCVISPHSDGKESACAGDPGSIPGSGKCPRVGNGCPLEHARWHQW